MLQSELAGNVLSEKRIADLVPNPASNYEILGGSSHIW